jgi:hypothetical protein
MPQTHARITNIHAHARPTHAHTRPRTHTNARTTKTHTHKHAKKTNTHTRTLTCSMSVQRRRQRPWSSSNFTNVAHDRWCCFSSNPSWKGERTLHTHTHAGKAVTLCVCACQKGSAPTFSRYESSPRRYCPCTSCMPRDWMENSAPEAAAQPSPPTLRVRRENGASVPVGSRDSRLMSRPIFRHDTTDYRSGGAVCWGAHV